jgi:hypothetical protein
MVETTVELDGELDRKLARISATVDSEFDEDSEESEYTEELKLARDVLYRASVMFRYLSDEEFCKTLTKRERVNLDKLADQCFDTIETLTAAISEAEGEE